MAMLHSTTENIANVTQPGSDQIVDTCGNHLSRLNFLTASVHKAFPSWDEHKRSHDTGDEGAPAAEEGGAVRIQNDKGSLGSSEGCSITTHLLRTRDP